MQNKGEQKEDPEDTVLRVKKMTLLELNELKLDLSHKTQDETLRYLLGMHKMLHSQGALENFNLLPAHLVQILDKFKEDSVTITEIQLRKIYEVLDAYADKLKSETQSH